MQTRLTAAILIAVLTGCGKTPDANKPPETGRADDGSAQAVPGNWNALDACATLDKDIVGRISGSPVTSTKLDPVVPGTEGTAAFSMCTYQLTNGAKLSVLTRQSPDADTTPAAIAAARTTGGTTAPAIDVPGLGKAAMWSETLKGLQVFIDDTRYVTINYFGLPGGADGKDQAIEIAKAIK